MPPLAHAPPARGRGALLACWAAVAAGAASLAAWLVQVWTSNPDTADHCPYIRKTDILGAALLGIGSAALTVGGVSLYLGSRGGMVGTESTAARAPIPPFTVAYHRRF